MFEEVVGERFVFGIRHAQKRVSADVFGVEDLGLILITAIDTETFLISPGLLAPPLVCVSYWNGSDSGLLDHIEGPKYVRKLLQGDSLIVGQNIVYDLAVLAAEDFSLVPLIFAAYDAGRIRDTSIRQKLLDLTDGTMKFAPIDEVDPETEEKKLIKRKYNLALLVERHSDRKLSKTDDGIGYWCLRFGTLKGKPIAEWPADAKKYALDDAKETFGVYLAQNNEAVKTSKSYKNGTVINECEQARAAWALHLQSVWGLRTDGKMVEEIKRELRAEKASLSLELIQSGLVKEGKKKLTKSTVKIRERVMAAYASRPDIVLPTTEKKQIVKISADVLQGSGDPLLEKLVEYEETEKLLSSFVPVIEKGTRVGINPSYNELVETGRVSARAPNVQQLPRKGGIRECFIPRPGFLYTSADYSALEMCSLAQVCLDLIGESTLAEVIRAGKDPHLMFGSQFLWIDYEEAQKRFEEGNQEMIEVRQHAKCANFGFPGGMGVKTFVAYCAGYGVKITEDRAKELRKNWLQTFIEMKKYFNWVSNELGPAGEGPIKQLRSNRIRYTTSFTSACNTLFQGLAADGAKEAAYRVAKECYAVPSSPLYGSRPVVFMHDELILEVPESRASEAADRLAVVMIEAMQKWIPDVPIKAEPVLMRRWWKEAKTVRVNGKLVPWEPKIEKKAAA